MILVLQNKILKRAQATGSAASILVLIILLLIIFYILFLPQSDRDALLGDGGFKTGSGSSGSGSGSSSSSNRLSPDTLLDERNIELYPGMQFHDKDLPDVTLKEIVNAKELVNLGQIQVRNSWFDTSSKNLSFRVGDYDLVENVILTFKVNSYSGKLTIVVNGYTVFDDAITSKNSPPINIDENILYEDNNIIEFSVDGVGMEFWKANEYALSDIRMIGDITDQSKQKSRNIFLLTNEEMDNIMGVDLDFYTSCSGSVGQLHVTLNGDGLLSENADCNEFYSLPISIDMLEEGDNVVMFSIDSGRMTVQNIAVRIDYKQQEKWRWRFYIDDDDWEDIEDEEKDVVMIIEFEDDDNNHADFQLNDHDDDFREDDDYVEIDITRYAEEGYNSLEIDPKSTFNIDRLRIVLED